ncbi:pleiotropic drug resistance abc transporter [Moniliophthora roreri]|uniref:CDR ABC transporter domain-containing protein n=1 Tax=Moniliophthora roreri TaxID=221103 RepID=A0A0W0F6F6_MONRR|nr:pleiotropic drug resistance abc transporter [Moniliophthora roreri]
MDHPFRWGFEDLITNEFLTIDGCCESLVPRGPGYENVGLPNQVYPTVGAVPGRDYVDGNRLTALSFEHTLSHTWKNFGIIIAFTVGLVGAALFLTERKTRTSSNQGAALYKRDTKTALKRSVKATFKQELATPWFYQTWQLLKRNNQSHYRDLLYLPAKLVLNVFSRLLIGFSLFKAKNTQQGTQNKLFINSYSWYFSRNID